MVRGMKRAQSCLHGPIGVFRDLCRLYDLPCLCGRIPIAASLICPIWRYMQSAFRLFYHQPIMLFGPCSNFCLCRIILIPRAEMIGPGTIAVDPVRGRRYSCGKCHEKQHRI
jgi:hypothetical protein